MNYLYVAIFENQFHMLDCVIKETAIAAKWSAEAMGKLYSVVEIPDPRTEDKK